MTIKPSASISKITSSGGQEFSFEPNEKVILVGPNNGGKSQMLREIMQIANQGSEARLLVLKQVEFAKSGSVSDLESFLDENAELTADNIYRYKNWALRLSAIPLWG